MIRSVGFLGQVPLAQSRPGLSSLAEGEEVLANGGIILRERGILLFFPDSDVLEGLEEALGVLIPEFVEVRVSFCNTTPGTVPVLGAETPGFLDR